MCIFRSITHKIACSSDRSRDAIRKEARDVSGMADLRTWELNLKFLARKAASQEQGSRFSIRRETRFAIESSKDSGVILPGLMSILLSLPGSAMTTMGLAWLTTISVRMGRPACLQASLPVRKSLGTSQTADC